MKRTKWIVVLSVVALQAAPSATLAFQAFNRLQVEPIGDGVFEVVARVGSSATDFWCGAGDYASRVLNAGATQRIYLWRAIGSSVTRPGKKAVQFSLSPPPGADTSTGYSVTVKRVGDNMNVSLSQSYCYDRRADAVIFQGA